MDSRRRKLALDNGVLVVDGEIVSRSPSNVPPAAGLRAGGGAGYALPGAHCAPAAGPRRLRIRSLFGPAPRGTVLWAKHEGPQGASPESVPKSDSLIEGSVDQAAQTASITFVEAYQ